MISSVAYADEEMLSEAKTARPVKTFSRSESSSCSEIGRPNQDRASAREGSAERGSRNGRGFLGDERVRARVPEVGGMGPIDANTAISRLTAMDWPTTSDHRPQPPITTATFTADIGQ